MGKRARFYMVPADLDEFEAFMRGKADVVFPPARSENPESMMLRGSLSDEASEHVGVMLRNRSISPKPLIVWRGERGGYSVDYGCSKVVEFTMSMIDEGSRMRRGRLWADMNSYDENFEAIPKSEEFARWYDSLARWVRSKARRVNQTEVAVLVHRSTSP